MVLTEGSFYRRLRLELDNKCDLKLAMNERSPHLDFGSTFIRKLYVSFCFGLCIAREQFGGIAASLVSTLWIRVGSEIFSLSSLQATLLD